MKKIILVLCTITLFLLTTSFSYAKLNTNNKYDNTKIAMYLLDEPMTV